MEFDFIKEKNYSILRKLQYDFLKKISLEGKILDLGGNKKSAYQSMIRGTHTFITVNIDKELDCDLIFDIQKEFPLDGESYDNVLCLNVLEHIYKFENVFKEANRILKRDGSFIFSVPFMYQIHSSPDDFFRFTESALAKLLIDNGFKDIKINRLNYGICSIIFQIVGGAIPTNFLRIIFKNLLISADKFFLGISKKYQKLNSRIPLGYMVMSKK